MRGGEQADQSPPEVQILRAVPSSPEGMPESDHPGSGGGGKPLRGVSPSSEVRFMPMSRLDARVRAVSRGIDPGSCVLHCSCGDGSRVARLCRVDAWRPGGSRGLRAGMPVGRDIGGGSPLRLCDSERRSSQFSSTYGVETPTTGSTTYRRRPASSSRRAAREPTLRSLSMLLSRTKTQAVYLLVRLPGS